MSSPSTRDISFGSAALVKFSKLVSSLYLKDMAHLLRTRIARWHKCPFHVQVRERKLGRHVRVQAPAQAPVLALARGLLE